MTDIEGLDMEQKEEIFVYLDDLRESGETNMFGAGPYLVRSFGIPAEEARKWLLYWMEEF